MFVFRALANNKTLRQSNRPMSYTSVREVVKNKCIQLGLDQSKYGVHSLRAGGATEAANRGVPERLFKRHGRWASDSSKDLYVKDSLRKRLSVSQNLGL